MDVLPKDVTKTCCLCVCVATANSSSHHMRTAWDAAQAAGANVEMLIVVRKHQKINLLPVFKMTHAGISSWNKKWSVVLSATQINELRGSFCCVRTGFLPHVLLCPKPCLSCSSEQCYLLLLRHSLVLAFPVVIMSV